MPCRIELKILTGSRDHGELVGHCLAANLVHPSGFWGLVPRIFEISLNAQKALLTWKYHQVNDPWFFITCIVTPDIVFLATSSSIALFMFRYCNYWDIGLACFLSCDGESFCRDLMLVAFLQSSGCEDSWWIKQCATRILIRFCNLL